MDARPIPPDLPELAAALEAADPPTEDLGDDSRTFFAFEDDVGRPVGFGGFELTAVTRSCARWWYSLSREARDTAGR